MGFLSRFRRRRQVGGLTEEERVGRYVYLLNTLPASVIESAHAQAFKDLPPERRRELFEQLRPFMADSERDAASDDPTVLAKLVRRAEERRAQRQGMTDAARRASQGAQPDPRDAVDPRGLLMSSGVAVAVSQNFLLSAAVMTYWSAGAGSLAMASEPAWIADTYDAGSSSGYDGGFGGGGYDGGGFGGSFDGGFGGGFGGDGGGGG